MGIEKEIGTVFVIAPDGPHKYDVSCFEKSADSTDLLNQIPIVYRFRDTKKRKGASQVDLIAKVTSKVVPSGRVSNIGIETHIDIVRVAIQKFQANSSITEILIKSDDMEDIRQNRRQGDPSLELELFKILQTINRFWPSEALGIDNLQLMVNSDGDELSGWLDVLVQKGYLAPPNRMTKILPLSGSGGNIKVYKLNPVHLNLRPDPVASLTGLRVFLSYSSIDKELAGEIKKMLEHDGKDMSLSVFLAHENIEVSEEWETKIIMELSSCHVFMPLLTDNFKGSNWTNQEAGFAIAKEKKIMALMCPLEPSGFLRKWQGDRLNREKINQTCQKILQKIRNEFSSRQLPTTKSIS